MRLPPGFVPPPTRVSDSVKVRVPRNEAAVVEYPVRQRPPIRPRFLSSRGTNNRRLPPSTRAAHRDRFRLTRPISALVRLPPSSHQGYVVDDARALASLGGGRGVSQACSSGRDAPKLLLRSRPSDPLARPLRADRASANGLVLRISRKDPGAGTRNAGVFDAGVSIVSVTRVTHAFRFRQMAARQHTRAAEDPTLAAVSGIAPSAELASDFRTFSRLATTHASDTNADTNAGAANDVTHTIDPTIAYVSVPKGHAFAMPMPGGPARDPFHVAARADAALRGAPPAPRADGSIESIEHGGLIGGLIAAPPVSSVNHPEDYRAARWKRARETRRPRGVPASGPAAPPIRCLSAVAAVPPALADAEAAEAREALGVPKAAADAIAAAFERRPVWAHDALLEALPAETRGSSAADVAAIEKAFPTFAFRFKDGPFRRLWTRRG